MRLVLHSNLASVRDGLFLGKTVLVARHSEAAEKLLRNEVADKIADRRSIGLGGLVD